MEITEVRVRLRTENKLKAYVNITVDNALAVRGMKVISGEKGLFVSMPSRKRKDGKYEDIVHPINNETRQEMEKVILEEYNRALETEGSENSENSENSESHSESSQESAE